MYQILVLNLGGTSTKASVYLDDKIAAEKIFSILRRIWKLITLPRSK